jgi:hypothetical protein
MRAWAAPREELAFWALKVLLLVLNWVTAVAIAMDKTRLATITVAMLSPFCLSGEWKPLGWFILPNLDLGGTSKRESFALGLKKGFRIRIDGSAKFFRACSPNPLVTRDLQNGNGNVA